ncbi:MAG TPA: hypothetical protein VN900_05040 [Stellaceae bacterium]|nr:hypothetical protein [Stellaceae bacterium]
MRNRVLSLSVAMSIRPPVSEPVGNRRHQSRHHLDWGLAELRKHC